MSLPSWLQELRDLLAISSDHGRQAALMTWEQRWLVELQAQTLVCQEQLETCRIDMLAREVDRVRHQLGLQLADIMVQITRAARSDPHGFVSNMLAICGDVMAIRREPKTDD